jgi:ferric-dicitrate binding protein FerR (iron transport regulator)
MPSQDAKRAPDARRLSRRTLLHGVATAGAAGIAATAMTAGPAMAATRQDAQGGRDETRLPDGPITVHVHNTRSGDIEVFCGDRKTRLHDQELAARIAWVLRHSS